MKPDSKSSDLLLFAPAVFLWAIVVFVVAILSHDNFPSNPTFVIGAHKFFPPEDKYFTPLMRFDALHYLAIANAGYKSAYPGLKAFLPLFCLTVHIAVKPFLFLFKKSYEAYILTGLGLNFFYLLGAMVFLKRQHESEFPERNGRLTSFLLLASPYAFYYLSFYNETLFLFLSILAFYLATRRRWGWACLVAGLASATRLQGALLLPALAVEYFHQCGWSIRRIRWNILWLALCPMGLALFVWHIGGIREYEAAARAWPQRIPDLNIFKPIWIYFKRYWEGNPQDFADAFNIGAIFTAAALLFFGWKTLRPSYRVFVLLCLITPLMSSSVQAIGRYYGAVFPLYMVASLFLERRDGVRFGIFIALAILQSLLIAFFTTGTWIG